MCGRYWIDESIELRGIAEEMRRSPLMERWGSLGGGNRAGVSPAAQVGTRGSAAEIKTGGEIRPTDIVPVIASNRSGERAVYPMKWGYSGKSLLVNARSETAAVKPTFREDWARHRCIVPAAWYFEWEHFTGSGGKKRIGDKYRIWPKDSAMTWLCGLYRIENGLPVFVVLTREPAEEIRFIHDRMPLMMPEKLVNDWIRPDARPEVLLGEALTRMTFEKTAVG